MKIAITAQDTGWDSPVDPRFGRTRYLFVYDEETEGSETYDNRDIENEAHGAGPRTAQKLAQFEPDVLITGNGPGGNAAAVLRQLDVQIVTGAGEMTVRQAYDAFRNGTLT